MVKKAPKCDYDVLEFNHLLDFLICPAELDQSTKRDAFDLPCCLLDFFIGSELFRVELF